MSMLVSKIVILSTQSSVPCSIPLMYCCRNRARLFPALLVLKHRGACNSGAHLVHSWIVLLWLPKKKKRHQKPSPQGGRYCSRGATYRTGITAIGNICKRLANGERALPLTLEVTDKDGPLYLQTGVGPYIHYVKFLLNVLFTPTISPLCWRHIWANPASDSIICNQIGVWWTTL
jgi:hypothetical protein